MKKTVFLSMLLALLLLLAPGASADSGCALGEAYLTVKANGTVRAVVTVTADRSCTLYTSLFDASGRFRGLTVQDVEAGTTERSIASVLSAPQEEGLYARFFLTERNSPTPLAQERIAAASGVYALLYEDGTLVFQTRNLPDPERGAAKVFPVDLRGYQVWYDYNRGINVCTAPWYAYRQRILRVEFTDIIRPLSTKGWFYECSNLTEISRLPLLDTSAVTDMSEMFYKCKSLTALDVSGFDTSAVTDMSNMFDSCKSLTALDMSGFDTSAVWNMEGMFYGCSRIRTIYASERFSTDSVKRSDYMFTNCPSLVGGNGTPYDSAHKDHTYARIDRPGTPGYFTAK